MSATDTAELFVFTHRKGLLSRFGHDLRLSARAFEIELAEGRLTGRFELRSLRVDGAMVRGSLDPAALSAADRAEIERTLAERIIQVAAHPEASFDGMVEPAQGNQVAFVGQLTLRGRTRSLAAQARIEAGRAHARLQLVPSNWGIEPFKAMGGALRLEDRVDVELVLHLRAAALDAADVRELAGRWRPSRA